MPRKIISQGEGYTGRKLFHEDRKTIGDFACFELLILLLKST